MYVYLKIEELEDESCKLKMGVTSKKREKIFSAEKLEQEFCS